MQVSTVSDHAPGNETGRGPYPAAVDGSNTGEIFSQALADVLSLLSSGRAGKPPPQDLPGRRKLLSKREDVDPVAGQSTAQGEKAAEKSPGNGSRKEGLNPDAAGEIKANPPERAKDDRLPAEPAAGWKKAVQVRASGGTVAGVDRPGGSERALTGAGNTAAGPEAVLNAGNKTGRTEGGQTGEIQGLVQNTGDNTANIRTKPGEAVPNSGGNTGRPVPRADTLTADVPGKEKNRVEAPVRAKDDRLPAEPAAGWKKAVQVRASGGTVAGVDRPGGSERALTGAGNTAAGPEAVLNAGNKTGRTEGGQTGEIQGLVQNTGDNTANIRTKPGEAVPNSGGNTGRPVPRADTLTADVPGKEKNRVEAPVREKNGDLLEVPATGKKNALEAVRLTGKFFGGENGGVAVKAPGESGQGRASPGKTGAKFTQVQETVLSYDRTKETPASVQRAANREMVFNKGQSASGSQETALPGVHNTRFETVPLSAESSGGEKGTALPELKDRLVQEVRSFINHKAGPQTQVQLKLEPEKLGHLTIKLYFQQGEINAHFYTGNEQVKEVLEGSLHQLKSSLNQLDLNLNEALVFVSGGNRENNSGRHLNEKNRYGRVPYRGDDRGPGTGSASGAVNSSGGIFRQVDYLV